MAEKPFDIKKTVTRLKTVGGAVMHVTAAAPRRDKLVRCVLKYRKQGAEEAKEYELETVGDHTTWEKLSERVVAALWPNRRDTQNTVAMLEFAPLAPPGAEVEVVYILEAEAPRRRGRSVRRAAQDPRALHRRRHLALHEGLRDSQSVARGAPSFRPGTASSAASGSNASYSRPGTPSRPPTAPVPEDAPAADDRPLSGAEAGLLSNMIGKGAFGK